MLYLAKILAVFASPLGIILCAGALGAAFLAWGWRRAGLALVMLALGFLWIAAMPVTARLALGALERAYPASAIGAAPSADVAIVLGGGVSGPTASRPLPDLHEAADRVLSGAALYKAGKVKAVLVSGGNLPWLGDEEPEAETMRRLLISWGVAPEAILIEGKSRTTAENAREVKAMWGGLGFTSALLVTSAAHMPRALATFRKAGLPVTPFPVDIRAAPGPAGLLEFLPDADALKQTSDAMKEAIGWTVYWLRGEA